ncbi:MAG: hypothetical protein HON14_01920 [Rhodospirillaceae bacterium]|nr:hypothetical protein [Rhodospirillaceae bacterium]
MNKLLILFGFMVVALTACSRQEPYIFKAEEFNRNSNNFAKELEDRTTVEICYNKRHTSPKILSQIATDECRRFGKRAHFSNSKTLECSISAPAMAQFWCLGPDETIEDLLNPKKSKPL